MPKFTDAIVVGDYAVSICCVEMHDMVRGGWGVPEERYGGKENIPQAMLGILDDDGICIIVARYCPSCGKKVQVYKIT